MTWHTLKIKDEISDRYLIDEYGQIYSIQYKRILSPWLHATGYLYLQIRHNGKRTPIPIHRLVAFSFIGSPNSIEQNNINHKDGNKFNNHYSNLEWCTKSENVKHAYDTGLTVSLKGEENPCAKLTEEQVKHIRNEYGTHAITIKELANRYNVSFTTMYNAIKKITWTHV